MENLELISHSGVSTTIKILRMLPGLKKESSTKIVKDFMAGLAWEVWQYWLWSFQGRDTKLERFLAKNLTVVKRNH